MKRRKSTKRAAPRKPEVLGRIGSKTIVRVRAKGGAVVRYIPTDAIEP